MNKTKLQLNSYWRIKFSLLANSFAGAFAIATFASFYSTRAIAIPNLPTNNLPTNIPTNNVPTNLPTNNLPTNIPTNLPTNNLPTNLLPGFPSPNLPTIKIPRFFNQLFSQFTSIANSYAGDIETFLSSLYGLSTSNGSIGLPDFQDIEQQLANNLDLDQLSNFFGTRSGRNASVQNRLRQEFLQDFGSEFVKNSIFSQEGQDKIQQKIEQALDTVDYSAQLQENSSGQDVSQNILRNISGQMSLQQQIDNMLLFEMQEQKVKDGLQIELSSEVLSEMGKNNVRRERENLAVINNNLHQNMLISVPGQGR